MKDRIRVNGVLYEAVYEPSPELPENMVNTYYAMHNLENKGIWGKVREWPPDYPGDDYRLEIFTKKLSDTDSYLCIRVTTNEAGIFVMSDSAYRFSSHYPDTYYDLFDDLAKALHGRIDKNYRYVGNREYAVVINEPPTMMQFKAIERVLDKYDLV